jgi:RNA polymerase sigma-70 factor (ECF subfamily)
MMEQPRNPEERMVGWIASHQAALHRYILSLLPDRSLADDVLQETNLVLWRKAAEYDDSRPFLAWAFTIARYQVMAARRDASRDRHVFNDQLVELLADEHPTDNDVTPLEEALQTCLGRLPDHQRALILARYEPGGSVQDLAKAHAKSPGALSILLLRIRKSLEDCIERQLGTRAS